VTTWITVDIGAARICGQVGVRVGMLVGRYLDDPVLVEAVAEHVVTGWLSGRDRFTDISNVEQWWNAYVELVEATAGGVDCATDDDLRRAWADHAGRLLHQRVSDPLSAAVSLVEPASVGGGR
jgi:hypothetical protein